MGAAASAQGGKPLDASDIADLPAGIAEVVAIRKSAIDAADEGAIAWLCGKPADGADIVTLEDAKAEVTRLRRAASVMGATPPAEADVSITVGGQSIKVGSECDLMAIKDEDGNVGGLNKLGLTISAIPDGIFTQLALTSLNVRGNQIGSLPAGIGALVWLTELNVAECGLKALPDEIGNCVRLEEIDASDNGLTALPTTIGGCASLKKLFLFKNKLSKIPDEISLCSQLEEINFFNNALRALPDSMANLTELTEVNVAGNAKLKYIPPTDKWTKVTLLALQWDGLNDTFWSMKSKFSLETMVSLEQLQLDHNKGLQALPKMGNMGNMKKLVLGAMKALKALPDEIGTAVQLESLDCNGCLISTIPAGIGNCVELSILNVGSNKLTALPAELGNCTKMKTLMCFANAGLTKLPASLCGCKAIDRANFKGCALDMSDADTKKVVDQFKAQCGNNFMM